MIRAKIVLNTNLQRIKLVTKALLKKRMNTKTNRYYQKIDHSELKVQGRTLKKTLKNSTRDLLERS